MEEVVVEVKAVLPLKPATVSGDGGGEAVVSLETATLNGDWKRWW